MKNMRISLKICSMKKNSCTIVMIGGEENLKIRKNSRYVFLIGVILRQCMSIRRMVKR